MDKNSIGKSFDLFSLLHTNIRSLRKNLQNLEIHLLNEVEIEFDLTGVSETIIATKMHL